MLFQTLPEVLFAIIRDYVCTDIDAVIIWSNCIEKSTYLAFSAIPHYLRHDMYYSYIVKYPSYLRYVPYQTQEICLAAMHYIENLLFVQKRFKTQEFCMAMVNKFGGIVLKYINKNSKGKKLCEAALKNDPLCFKFIPKNIQYIINYASISNVCMNSIFNDIPDELKTQAMCDIAFYENSKNLIYVPEKFLTQSMCDSAFTKNPIILEHIPKKYITQNMCDIAANNPHISKNMINYIFEYIPIEFLTQSMCDSAFGYNPRNIRYTPKEYITQSMCDRAFGREPWNILYIPKEYITQNMRETAVRFYPSINIYLNPLYSRRN